MQVQLHTQTETQAEGLVCAGTETDNRDSVFVWGELEVGNGSLRSWDLTSLDWVRDMGINRGRGKGIRRPNSRETLPWGDPSNSAWEWELT